MINLIFAVTISAIPTAAKVPHVFYKGSPAKATEVNENFQALDSSVIVVRSTIDSIKVVNLPKQEFYDSIKAIRKNVIDDGAYSVLSASSLVGGGLTIASSQNFPVLKMDNSTIYWGVTTGRNYYAGVDENNVFGIGTQALNKLTSGKSPLLEINIDERRKIAFPAGAEFRDITYFQSGVISKYPYANISTGVLDAAYPLMSLDSLSKVISITKSLPGVPSLAEVQNSGLDLVKMNILLLKKIEEMTLYIINQEARIKALEAKP